tara:strand:+ start:101 stop:475 length:375 start_codon:yes stop_codon:yes gene_type:complete
MKINYINTLTVTRYVNGKGKLFYLAEDYSIIINGEIFTIPKGTPTDFASFPKIGCWLTLGDKLGDHLEASVVHDYMYITQSKNMNRYDADCIFYYAMKKAGVNPIQRIIMFLAVRAFGWLYWYK